MDRVFAITSMISIGYGKCYGIMEIMVKGLGLGKFSIYLFNIYIYYYIYIIYYYISHTPREAKIPSHNFHNSITPLIIPLNSTAYAHLLLIFYP